MKRIFIFITSVVFLSFISCYNGVEEIKYNNPNDPANYSISLIYDGNGSTSGTVPSAIFNCSPFQSITVSGNPGNLKKTGKTFTGWNTKSDGTGDIYTEEQTYTLGSARVILYAVWTTSPTYTVTYAGNGNSSGTVPSNTTNYTSGQIVAVSGNSGNLKKTGYTFIGWNAKSDGSGDSYSAGQTLTNGGENITLYACWTSDVTYTLTYNGNGDSGGGVPSNAVHYASGQVVTVLGNTGNLVKFGYLFNGWNTNSSGTGTSYTEGQNFTMGGANVTLYAKWTKSYTVTYDGNGKTSGSIPAGVSAYMPGQIVTVLGNSGNLVNGASSFYCWNTKADGSGVNYTEGQTITMAKSNVTLYACWLTGLEWVEHQSSGSRSWGSITSSSDGTKLAAYVSYGYIYTSSDSGLTWVEQTGLGSRDWVPIALSTDGTKLAAVAYYPPSIFTSDDSGATWVERTGVVGSNWTSITSSSDGTKLAVTPYFGSINISEDSGATWSERPGAGSNYFYYIISSASGTKLVASKSGGSILISEDSGATWTQHSVAKSCIKVSSASDGTKLAGTTNDYVYTSEDSGITWTQHPDAGSRSWSSTSMSSDSTRIVACSRNGYYGSGHIYTSDDGGVTWTLQVRAGNKDWISVALSSDGKRIAACANNGYIYTADWN